MYEYNVNTTDYDEAIEQAKEDSYLILYETLKRNANTFSIVMNKCRKYEYNGCEDFDCEEIDAYDVELNELYDDKDEMIEELSTLVYELTNEKEELKNELRKLKGIR